MFVQDKILCADGMAWDNDKVLKSLCVFIWMVLARHMLLLWKGFWISWHDYVIIFCTLVWLFCFWSGRLWGLASFLKEKLWCFTSFKTDKHLQCFFLHSSGTGGRMLIKIPILVVLPLSIRTISFCLTISSNIVF